MTENEQPLTSWKEIAGYLQRSPRTVHRWEESEGLPIRRHRHAVRNSVYAYPSELDAWRQNRRPETEAEPVPLWRRPLPSFVTGMVMLLALISVGDASSDAILARAQGAPTTTREVENVVGIDPSNLSPDGSFAAFTNWEKATDPATSRVAYGGLAVRDMRTGETRQLTWEQDGYDSYVDEVRVAPDSRTIAYGEFFTRGGEKRLQIIPVDGSAPARTVFSPQEYFEILDWTPDGRQILISNSHGDGAWELALISMENGSLKQLKSTPWQRTREASISPDGRFIAYALMSKDRLDRDIFLLSIDGDEETPLLQHPSADYAPVWSPDGSSLFFMSQRTTSPSLWSIPLRDGKPAGEPHVVKGDIGPAALLKMTSSGTLYYRVDAQERRNIYSVGLGEDGRAVGEPKLATEQYFGSNYGAALSPDGKRLAFYSLRPQQTLVIRDLENGRETTFAVTGGLLTRAGGWQMGPRWFPDGKSVWVTAVTEQRNVNYRFDAATGAVEEIDLRYTTIQNLSPDAKAIYGRGPTLSELIKVEIQTGKETVLREGLQNVWDVALSPDGVTLAYAASVNRGSDGGTTMLYVMPSAGGEPRRIAKEDQREGASRFDAISWTPDSRFVLWVDRSAKSVLRIPPGGGEPVDLDLRFEGGIRGVGMTPDQRSLFFTGWAPGPASRMYTLENFLPAKNGE